MGMPYEEKAFLLARHPFKRHRDRLRIVHVQEKVWVDGRPVRAKNAPVAVHVLQAAQPFLVRIVQRRRMTPHSVLRKGDEVPCVRHPGHGCVMVAHQDHIAGRAAKRHRLDRIRPIADDIPQADYTVCLMASCVRERNFKRHGIRMDV